MQKICDNLVPKHQIPITHKKTYIFYALAQEIKSKDFRVGNEKLGENSTF